MNRIRTTGTIAVVLAAITTIGILPGTAQAQSRRHDVREDQRHNNRDNRNHDNHGKDDNRQNTKNEWRNLATAAGGVAVLGLLSKDKTLTFAGAAGALYSLSRYEQDRKSQSKDAHARYSIFSQPYFYRDGKRYDRELVTQNGQRYYRFRRH